MTPPVTPEDAPAAIPATSQQTVDWANLSRMRPKRGSRRGQSTRDAILAAASDLMADQGPEAVSLRLILERAGVANESAIHYHFGSREGLMIAILLERSAIEPMRAAMLADVASRGGPLDVEEAVRCLAAPGAAAMTTRKDRNYLRIAAHVTRNLPALDRRRPDEPTIRAAIDLIDAQIPQVPEPVRTERLAAVMTLTVELWASRAAEIERGIPSILGDDAFLDNLVTMLVAMVTAPVSVGSA